jgi:hypothetical protein
MRLTKLQTTLALLATAAGLSGVGTLATGAQARIHVGLITGNPGGDDFCRDVAIALNERFAMGQDEDGMALVEQARQLGCRLVVTIAPDGVAAPRGTTAPPSTSGAAATPAYRVVALRTGSASLDGHCRDYARQINQASAGGNAALANAILEQGRQKGCRFRVLPVVGSTGATVLTARAD